MKAKTAKHQIFTLFFILTIFLVIISCNTRPAKKVLVYKDYPNLKIGFSTQNFQKAMPLNVESITELIGYASVEGYQFIEIRDDLAKLTAEECKTIAQEAEKNKIDVIYEIHKNLLDTGYFRVFEKGLANTLLLPGPGIIRTVVSKTEFDSDLTKKGWTKEELMLITKISDSCATIARSKNIKFIVENFNESFFGDSTYFGLTDFFANTSLTGLQLDLGNPYRSAARVKADPLKVEQYLSTMGNRWVTTHLKTVQTVGGEMQPFLTENPMSVEKVVDLMGKQNVLYGALELAAVPDKQQCFDNHVKSIQFLKDKGVLKN
jgi:sugar phosphate isomerase/epimerase